MLVEFKLKEVLTKYVYNIYFITLRNYAPQYFGALIFCFDEIFQFLSLPPILGFLAKFELLNFAESGLGD